MLKGSISVLLFVTLKHRISGPSSKTTTPISRLRDPKRTFWKEIQRDALPETHSNYHRPQRTRRNCLKMGNALCEGIQQETFPMCGRSPFKKMEEKWTRREYLPMLMTSWREYSGHGFVSTRRGQCFIVRPVLGYNDVTHGAGLVVGNQSRGPAAPSLGLATCAALRVHSSQRMHFQNFEQWTTTRRTNAFWWKFPLPNSTWWRKTRLHNKNNWF